MSIHSMIHRSIMTRFDEESIRSYLYGDLVFVASGRSIGIDVESIACCICNKFYMEYRRKSLDTLAFPLTAATVDFSYICSKR